MRELTLTEVEEVSGAMTPFEGISATLGIVGLGVLLGAGAPIVAFGLASIGVIAVIDVLHPTPGGGGRHLLGSSNLTNTKDACA